MSATPSRVVICGGGVIGTAVDQLARRSFALHAELASTLAAELKLGGTGGSTP